MKLKYNKQDDILVIEYSNDKIDDAYESNNMLVHVNVDKEASAHRNIQSI